MSVHARVQLHDDADVPLANVGGITALWWDAEDPIEFVAPTGRASGLSTDATGWLSLDLQDVSGHAVGGVGFLLLRKADAVDDQDSLIFAGQITTEDATGGARLTYKDSWERPADWLVLPTVGPTEQKFVGLLAITDDDSNYVAINASGAYTVDWGDGSALQNSAAGTQCQHKYTYSSISADTTSSRGYRQVIVTVTPQAGQSLTMLSLNVRPTQYSAVKSTQWLDVEIGSPALTDLRLGSSTYPGTTTTVMGLYWLERFTLRSSALTSLAYMFYYCIMLQSVSLSGAGGVTSLSAAFYGCSALRGIPFFQTGTVTAADNMFYECTRLVQIPKLALGSAASFATMFTNCRSLQSIPLLDTHSATSVLGMFSGCISLRTIPLLDVAAVTNFTNMFNGCTTLESIPAINTGSATLMTNMFVSCSSLQTVPLLDTADVTNLSSMFSGCINLRTVPPFNLTAAVNVASMFNNCTALQRVPSFTGGTLITTISNMFANCQALQSIGSLAFSAVTAATTPFSNCPSLARCGVSGFGLTHSYASCRLSAAALNEIFTALPTVSARTITITGNPGASDGATNRAIATAKGWTVTG
ncbi:hypothetical protein dqs_0607 [Azoarcus olearius]|uniref:BspA family leucine-rich repeat surface protein n=1 Tax=Azoarcus sp. (strain BH72) TaxID=418699 RepID=UPI000806100E|nr:BspA family leucine-rich repeat surface protein [Azoarcus olearius]ANQ83683.1 hypothetical protein dqs_0607 [Azoarcus olearius]